MRRATRKAAGLGGFAVALLLVASPPAFAQGAGGGSPDDPPTAREAAPVDLTGTWVSVVSEDWRWRMVTPARGDFASIPLSAEGRRVGLEWDPAADEAAGLQCKAYGAPAVMRIPGRVRISWQDDETLRIETDQGMQTRSLRFGVPAAASEPSSRQGYSVANWEPPAQGIGQPDAFGLFSGRIGRQPRSLEVTTTNLLPGYLRRNGPPYSPDAVLQEYFDHHVQPSGDEWFTVTTVVTDPTYLTGAFITSSDFRKEPNDDGFDPAACSAR
ncbi:hypothetical protein [Candidatus Rariloculus sp.]|uniref:hypothetical protein n=1 Tax=Candidatus Rariloculus sp. TaxID=3101265 RepID=UPI003D0F56D8